MAHFDSYPRCNPKYDTQVPIRNVTFQACCSDSHDTGATLAAQTRIRGHGTAKASATVCKASQLFTNVAVAMTPSKDPHGAH